VATAIGLVVGLLAIAHHKSKQSKKNAKAADKTVSSMQKRLGQAKKTLEMEGKATWEELEKMVRAELAKAKIRGAVAQPHVSKAVDRVVKTFKSHFNLSRHDAKILAGELKKDWKNIKAGLKEGDQA